MNKKENNRLIQRRVLWFIAGMLIFVGCLMLTKYWVTGTVTISVGVITAIITRNVHRLMEGNEYDESQPRWFWKALALGGTFGTLFGIVGCQRLARFVYEATSHTITPWRLFFIVAILMAALFLYAYLERRANPRKAYRFYTSIMVFACCFTISQCIGSISANKKIDHEEWKKNMTELEELKE